jgi:hypothetical protein
MGSQIQDTADQRLSRMAFGGLIWQFPLACGRNPPPVPLQCMTFEGPVPSLTLALCAPESASLGELKAIYHLDAVRKHGNSGNPNRNFEGRLCV